MIKAMREDDLDVSSPAGRRFIIEESRSSSSESVFAEAPPRPREGSTKHGGWKREGERKCAPDKQAKVRMFHAHGKEQAGAREGTELQPASAARDIHDVSWSINRELAGAHTHGGGAGCRVIKRIVPLSLASNPPPPSSPSRNFYFFIACEDHFQRKLS